ncbi:LysM peptidoglycan-binding domain-containing protein, partial [Pseudonocardia sp. K10HN5]|nr:LysM peptidoglycan-binding domain-containing protein [Pseudonocardia acidicola]
PAPVPAAPAGANYVVKAGDTLSEIAAANGTNWQNLQTLNGLPDPDFLSIGQQLRLA